MKDDRFVPRAKSSIRVGCRRLLQLLPMLAVILALLPACGAARAASLFEEDNAIPNAIAEIREKIGGAHVRALSVAIDADVIAIKAQDPRNPRHVDEWRFTRMHIGLFHWDSLSDPRPVELDLINPDLEANLFDLGDVDFAASARLMRAAIERAALEDEARVIHIEIARQVAILPKPSSGAVQWTVEVGSERESAEIFADASGTITGADLSRTNRAKTVDILQQPELMANAGAAFRATAGPGRILTRISVGADSIAFATNEPDKSFPIAGLPASVVYQWSLSGLVRTLGKVKLDLESSLGPPPDAPFGIDEVDWAIVPKLEAAARQSLGMPQGRISEVELSKPAEGVGTPVLLWRIEVTDANGDKGLIRADMKGAVTQVLLPESRRGPIDLFDPPAMLEALAKIDREFGPAGRFAEIRFVRDKAILTAIDPRQPGEFAQFVMTREGFSRFGMASMFATQRPLFAIADLRPLTAAKIGELEKRTLAELKMPPDKVSDVTIGRGGMDPSPKGNVTIEIRAEERPFGRDGRINFEMDGTAIATYLPDDAPAIAGPPAPSASADYPDCEQQSDPDRSIAACTRVLAAEGETAHLRAVAYTDRGLAYFYKGALDRAIADQSASIKLDPGYVNAFVNRGLAYAALGDYGRAVADDTEALRLDPGSAIAHNNRGIAYHGMDKLDEAIADYSEAIRLDPGFARAFMNRGRGENGKGDTERAIADFDTALRLDPKNEPAYFGRARAYLARGSLARAQADLKEANELAPKDAYAALWLDLVERRNNLPSRLREIAAQVDAKAWPGPVIRLFLGELTSAQVLAAAADPDPKKNRGQLCEANFYGGEMALLKTRKDEARRLFRLAAANCPRAFVEWEGANAELKALAAGR